jgi:hypothetical protein
MTFARKVASECECDMKPNVIEGPDWANVHDDWAHPSRLPLLSADTAVEEESKAGGVSRHPSYWGFPQGSMLAPQATRSELRRSAFDAGIQRRDGAVSREDHPGSTG